MALVWKDTSSPRFKGETFDTAQVIVRCVDDAPEYHDGQVERLTARMNKLLQVVAEVVNHLPPEAQRHIVCSVDWAHEEVKED